MRCFAAKVELLGPSGCHLRYVPAAMAEAMVSGGSAAVANQNGKVKSIKLVATAATAAQRIGEPTEGNAASRFAVREWLDSGFRVWKHHARCTYE